jgi:hypothetical protein
MGEKSRPETSRKAIRFAVSEISLIEEPPIQGLEVAEL